MAGKGIRLVASSAMVAKRSDFLNLAKPVDSCDDKFHEQRRLIHQELLG